MVAVLKTFQNAWIFKDGGTSKTWNVLCSDFDIVMTLEINKKIIFCLIKDVFKCQVEKLSNLLISFCQLDKNLDNFWCFGPDFFSV